MFFISFCLRAQEVTWIDSARKINKDTYELHWTAKISNPWHIYSHNMPDGGPVPTNIQIDHNPAIIKLDTLREVGKLITKYEPAFGFEVKYYENAVDFVQVIRLKPSTENSITGSIMFMVCKADRCMPPAKVFFHIPLN